jgi:hypothetical protein
MVLTPSVHLERQRLALEVKRQRSARNESCAAAILMPSNEQGISNIMTGY